MRVTIYKTFKGTNTEYAALHAWVRKNKGRASFCSDRGANEKHLRYEWANVSHKYKKDVDDYISLCRPCHFKYDRKTPADYWHDEYCVHGHRLTVDNLYLHPEKRTHVGHFLVCKRCSEESRIKNRLKGKTA